LGKRGTDAYTMGRVLSLSCVFWLRPMIIAGALMQKNRSITGLLFESDECPAPIVKPDASPGRLSTTAP